MQLFLLGGKALSQENWARPQVALVVKNPPANAGHAREAGSIPRSGRSTGEGKALHSSILAWKIPWTEEPGPLQSMRSQRVRHDQHDQHFEKCFSGISSRTISEQLSTEQNQRNNLWLFSYL